MVLTGWDEPRLTCNGRFGSGGVGISASQLGSGLLGGELPLDPGTGRVALLLPGRDLGDEDVALADAGNQGRSPGNQAVVAA